MCDCDYNCIICNNHGDDIHCLTCVFKSNFNINIKFDEKQESIICLDCGFVSLNPECFPDDEDSNEVFDIMRTHKCEPVTQ